MTKQKILFLINPISGVLQKKNIPAQIEKHLDFTKYDYQIKYTEYAGHATLLAKEAVDEGYNIVVAVGGDGSINEVANALVHTETALGIIPYGSGNGLGNHLHLPARNAQKAIEVLNTGKVVKVDTVQTNARYFFNCAGFGLDSVVARRFKYHKIRGFSSYVWAVLKELFYYYTPIEATVEIDELTIHRDFFLFTVFNGNQYGYQFGIFPNTGLRDGVLDVVVLNRFPLWKLPYVFFCLFFKRADLIKEAESFRARTIKVYGSKKMILQFDGDPLLHPEDLEMQVVSRSLNIMVPIGLNSY